MTVQFNDPDDGHLRDAFFPIYNTPQEIKIERKDDRVYLIKQDLKLAIEREDFPVVLEVFRWVHRAGIVNGEAEQSFDLLKKLAMEMIKEDWR